MSPFLKFLRNRYIYPGLLYYFVFWCGPDTFYYYLFVPPKIYGVDLTT